MSVAAITNMEAHGPKDEVGQLEVSQKNLLSSHWAYVDGAFFVPSKYLRQPSQGPLVSDETLCVLVYWKIKDYAKFLAGVKDFQHLTRQEEKVKYYGFCVYGSKAICREGYDSAEGFLEHLQNVDGPLKTAMQCADIESVEVHGPSSEVNKLRERLKSFPAVFWPYPNDSFLAPAQFSCEPLREAEEQRIRRDAADRYAADKARARQKAVDRSRRERARQKEEERAWQEAVERSRREAEEELQARTAQLQIAVAAAEAGDFAPLVSLARDGTDGQKEQAARALRNLACNADNQVAIARAGGRRSAAGAA
ncbi:hypothetical protein EMIHUDRAFT_441276 [Emiliania huxleyi CCMP1516]|uniref:Uncharacterized protein n=2 Tax=Emiliania huxleyi TaxID=2903 RepID=A0A0D3KFB9_EMIH1|nr:hypothetical protein EMIHUDRAFT_441276 [Emiliania huxleyi CCMP1516]EOD34454.1 hypothetical protein EMIHUDRAFT_441276 [Emiliania huxleyi CCMP1516]|eukprot:XP_005786883.1 hypothetical protein EMIHUDRAFT_441276 [Emiliania huxleyi CCMP1516]